jgi:hypothetical protein
MDLDLSLGRHRKAFESALAEAVSKSYVGRIWSKDATLWKTDEPHRKIIENALGWLDVARQMKANISGIQKFTNEIRQNGFTGACLLGMGGSSLCPEVCARTFGTRAGYLDLTVLDTTDPDTVLASERRLNPGPGDYVALLAYVERSSANDAALEIARTVIRDRLRCATTVGYGPRYLHSTGQLHKGGANNGVFILLTGIPGEAYSRAGSWGQTPTSLALSIIYAILELEKGP